MLISLYHKERRGRAIADFKQITIKRKKSVYNEKRLILFEITEDFLLFKSTFHVFFLFLL